MMRFQEVSRQYFSVIKAMSLLGGSYSLGLIGLEAVHVVGASDAPGAQELEQVDLHWCLHEDKVVV